MSNSRLVLVLGVSGALLGGFVGTITGMIAGMGTSVLIPGWGLVISGSLFLGIVCGLIGIFSGFLLGLLAAAIMISSQGKNLP